MLKQNRNNSPRGFSLIELLVVVSIISMLISITIPSLSKARIQARRTICSTRLKGLETAFQIYLAEWDTKVPTNGLIMPKSMVPTEYAKIPAIASTEAPNPQQWRLEYGALWPYMSGGTKLPDGYSLETAATNPVPVPRGNVRDGYRAYLCPEDTLNRTHPGEPQKDNHAIPLKLDVSNPQHPIVNEGADALGTGYWSYSVNPVLNSLGRFRNRFNLADLPWNDPLRMMKVKSPQDFICFIEEDESSLFNDEVMDAPAYSEGDYLTNRHGGYGNVGFGDGHVEKFSATLFNHVPSAIDTGYVQSEPAMSSDITRMFFPDRGAFALQQ